MSNKKRNKTPVPIAPDIALEEKAQTFLNSPQTALALTEEVRLEKVKTNNGKSERLAARSRNGKFVSRTETSAMVTAKNTQTFLATTDTETGLSRHETLLGKLYEGAKKAADEPRALGNSVKAVELLDEISGHRAVREEALKDRSNIVSPVKIVMVPSIALMNPTIIMADEKKPEKKTPSFIDAEFSTNPPQG